MDILRKPPLALTCRATASSLTGIPSAARQLTSIGTTTGKRWLFRRSTLVPSALIGRFLIFTGLLSAARLAGPCGIDFGLIDAPQPGFMVNARLKNFHGT